MADVLARNSLPGRSDVAEPRGGPAWPARAAGRVHHDPGHPAGRPARHGQTPGRPLEPPAGNADGAKGRAQQLALGPTPRELESGQLAYRALLAVTPHHVSRLHPDGPVRAGGLDRHVIIPRDQPIDVVTP